MSLAVLEHERMPGCLTLLSGQKEERDWFTAASIRSTVDFNVVGNWIKTCEKKHGNHCSPNWTENCTLRLIHCDSRRIIETPKPPEISTYAALSYVWGSQESDEASSGELPEQLPKTIEDAITVTKRLGIPYVWIDRYCIDQGDDNEKHRQCGLMHKIYEGAYITIIAAAGNGPDYGLPGIGSSKRSYPSVRIRSRLLVPTLPDPRLSLRAAKWSTRGWTYQEGVFSKRRLIFTDRQVLFRCGICYTNEAEQKLKPDTELPEEPTMSLYPFFEFSGESHIWGQINRFVKLDLGREKDTLNAMLGILQRYQELGCVDDFRLRHLGGLPALNREPSKIDKQLKRFHYPNWTPRFLNSLGWMVQQPSKRRGGFPSWSWTGWKAIQFEPPYGYLHDSRAKDRWEKAISVELPDGCLVKDHELDSMIEAEHDFSRIRFIRLKAPSLEFTIVPRKLRRERRWHSVTATDGKLGLIGYSDTNLLCPFELTDASVHIPKDGLRCWGILIIENLSTDVALLLVVTKVKDWYERIGVVEVHEPKILQALETRTFRLG